MDWAHKTSIFLRHIAICNPFQRTAETNQEETIERHKVMLRFENYCETLPELTRDGTPRPGAHGGYGIKSIRATAQKYGGTVTVHCDNNWFTLRVLLPQEKRNAG